MRYAAGKHRLVPVQGGRHLQGVREGERPRWILGQGAGPSSPRFLAVLQPGQARVIGVESFRAAGDRHRVVQRDGKCRLGFQAHFGGH